MDSLRIIFENAIRSSHKLFSSGQLLSCKYFSRTNNLWMRMKESSLLAKINRAECYELTINRERRHEWVPFIEVHRRGTLMDSHRGWRCSVNRIHNGLPWRRKTFQWKWHLMRLFSDSSLNHSTASLLTGVAWSETIIKLNRMTNF